MKTPRKIGLKSHLIKLCILCSALISSAFAEPEILSSNIKTEALASHNHWRQLHDAPALSWDSKLQEYAEHHASRCVFKHSHTPFGENLAAGYPSITAAVNAWYAEEAQYSYRSPGFSKATGHFTQVVWVGTQKLGCAIASCHGKNGTPGSFLVCEYSPPGNITNAGYFEQNVKKPSSPE